MHVPLCPFLLLSLASCGALAFDHANETLWGAYRPNLYFGLRPRIPQSLMTGLIWFGTQDYKSVGQARHACDQGDKLDKYTWTEYDAREGGVQVIRDGANNVEITTEFLKVPGGEHGGSWAARVRGAPIDSEKISRISTIFYFSVEGMGGMEMETDENEDGIEGDIKFTGSTIELDDFAIRVVDGPDNRAVSSGHHSEDFKNRIGKTHYSGLFVKPDTLWKAKDHIINTLLLRAREVVKPFTGEQNLTVDPSFILQLPDDIYTNSNLFAVQKLFDGPFQFDVFFESASGKQKLTSTTLDLGIPALVASYAERFQVILPYPEDYPESQRASLESFSKQITANLLAGVGYFYGNSIVNNKFAYEWDEDEDAGLRSEGERGARLTEPRVLLTATPSRSFFPRGFYWDEGFHLLHIGQVDNDFSLEILKDWINLIDDEGWIAREQILGEEARSKVPVEFLAQVPNYANPPTLTMAVTAYIARVKAASIAQQPSDFDLGMREVQMSMFESPHASSQSLKDVENAREFLRSIYAPLKRHYDWFRRTQRGQIKQYGRQARSRREAYRWRGRSETHVLTSGMDDYPRGPPHAGELHLDLISWMAFFSDTMREISEFVGEDNDAVTYEEIRKDILNNIEDLHWSEEKRMYCDVDVNDDDESYHVCHKGYVSLFPFLLGLLDPDSPHLGSILDLVHDPQHLWSDYGLRSLSASHPEFGQGENYWRGAIWVQMNYLALRVLYHRYTVEEGPHREQAQMIYNDLRKNVVNNVVKEYERTGYVWEQYDAVTGEGRRSHPFTGWTSLTALILSEKY